MQSQQTSGIEFKLGFFPLAFILFACTPVVVINGAPQRLKWGTHFVPLAPGQYHIEVFFPYMLMRKCGRNTIDVNVQPGRVHKVSYYAPLLMFMKGSLGEKP
jgi:hypothetical protein